jgi:hypothetical protein
MNKNLKLLVLDERKQSKDRRIGSRLDRAKALNAILASGAKIRHDSGGRLIIVEVTKEAEKSLAKDLPEMRLVSASTDVRDSITNLDATESLFLDALKIRSSKKFQDAKKKRKFGETPEEKQLLSAPDVREEY